MELGMVHRGEHSEIATFVGQTVDSELSGNMIDVCPVGALTSKPFRYSARTWELSRRKSVSPHDATGANLIVQVKGSRVMRVLPLENEDVNECWLADRDRFSYEALNSDERLTTPAIKQGGEWRTVDWTTALEYVANGLKQVVAENGPAAVGALATPHSTLEELHLLGKLTRALGSDNIDHRLRAADFSPRAGVTWLGLPIAGLSSLQQVFVIGSNLRKDHPLFAQRIRQATRRGAQVHSLHAVHDDWAMKVATQLTAAPSTWLQVLADVAAAVAEQRGVAAPVEAQPPEAAKALAKALLSGERKAVLLGNAAAHHPQASQLLALAQWVAQQTGASVGYLTEAANTVGAQLVRAQPQQGGLDAGQMLSQPLKAYLLLNVEPALDTANAAATIATLKSAGMVVSLSPFKNVALDVADVLLPIAPFSETAGSFVNAEGRVQSFHGVVKPLGDTRPAWKVLRVLANLLGLSGFSQETIEDVRTEALHEAGDIASRLDNAAGGQPAPVRAAAPAGLVLERLAEVPLYHADAIVRRAPSLQLTADAKNAPWAGLSPSLWQHLDLQPGAAVRIAQGDGHVVLPARIEASLAANVVRVPAGHPATAALGAMFGELTIEKA
jgi:NADH-quinone oxidoreductase subunit G